MRRAHDVALLSPSTINTRARIDLLHELDHSVLRAALMEGLNSSFYGHVDATRGAFFEPEDESPYETDFSFSELYCYYRSLRQGAWMINRSAGRILLQPVEGASYLFGDRIRAFSKITRVLTERSAAIAGAGMEKLAIGALDVSFGVDDSEPGYPVARFCYESDDLDATVTIPLVRSGGIFDPDNMRHLEERLAALKTAANKVALFCE